MKTWSSMYSCIYTGILKNLILKWKSNEFFANISDDNSKNQQISKLADYPVFFACKWNVTLEFETDKEQFFFDQVLSSNKFTFCQVHPPTQIFALSFHPPVIYVSVSACIFDHAMCMYSSLA